MSGDCVFCCPVNTKLADRSDGGAGQELYRIERLITRPGARRALQWTREVSECRFNIFADSRWLLHFARIVSWCVGACGMPILQDRRRDVRGCWVLG